MERKITIEESVPIQRTIKINAGRKSGRKDCWKCMDGEWMTKAVMIMMLSGKVSMKALYEKHNDEWRRNKNIAKIYFACRERSRKVSSQCELYSDGSGVLFLHRRKVLFLLLSTERKKSVGRISPSERISGEMCRLSG